MPLRAGDRRRQQPGGLFERAGQHVSVGQQQRGLLVAGACRHRLVQRHDGQRRILGLDRERAGAPQLFEALLFVGVAVALVEQQPRQLSELARLFVERGEQVDQRELLGRRRERGLDGRRGVGRPVNPLGERDELARRFDLRVAVDDAHVVLGRGERAVRVAFGLRQLPGQAHRLGVGVAAPTSSPSSRRAIARSPAPRASSARRRVASLKSAAALLPRRRDATIRAPPRAPVSPSPATT